jgi:hypothetical protein
MRKAPVCPTFSIFSNHGGWLINAINVFQYYISRFVLSLFKWIHTYDLEPDLDDLDTDMDWQKYVFGIF